MKRTRDEDEDEDENEDKEQDEDDPWQRRVNDWEATIEPEMNLDDLVKRRRQQQQPRSLPIRQRPPPPPTERTTTTSHDDPLDARGMPFIEWTLATCIPGGYKSGHLPRPWSVADFATTTTTAAAAAATRDEPTLAPSHGIGVGASGATISSAALYKASATSLTTRTVAVVAAAAAAPNEVESPDDPDPDDVGLVEGQPRRRQGCGGATSLSLDQQRQVLGRAASSSVVAEFQDKSYGRPRDVPPATRCCLCHQAITTLRHVDLQCRCSRQRHDTSGGGGGERPSSSARVCTSCALGLVLEFLLPQVDNGRHYVSHAHALPENSLSVEINRHGEYELHGQPIVQCPECLDTFAMSLRRHPLAPSPTYDSRYAPPSAAAVRERVRRDLGIVGNGEADTGIPVAVSASSESTIVKSNDPDTDDGDDVGDDGAGAADVAVVPRGGGGGDVCYLHHLLTTLSIPVQFSKFLRRFGFQTESLACLLKRRMPSFHNVLTYHHVLTEDDRRSRVRLVVCASRTCRHVNLVRAVGPGRPFPPVIECESCRHLTCWCGSNGNPRGHIGANGSVADRIKHMRCLPSYVDELGPYGVFADRVQWTDDQCRRMARILDEWFQTTFRLTPCPECGVGIEPLSDTLDTHCQCRQCGRRFCFCCGGYFAHSQAEYDDLITRPLPFGWMARVFYTGDYSPDKHNLAPDNDEALERFARRPPSVLHPCPRNLLHIPYYRGRPVEWVREHRLRVSIHFHMNAYREAVGNEQFRYLVGRTTHVRQADYLRPLWADVAADDAAVGGGGGGGGGVVADAAAVGGGGGGEIVT